MMNKRMHPRNRYRNPPDFKELAIKYEQFRQFAQIDISGKVKLDFKDPAALRALTTVLLKHDWDLNIVIPPDKLVPTLPLRLNYILWIEDLLTATKPTSSGSPVHGIDIGTGASCIYPLLSAKKNQWHMLGSEIDADSLSCAQENIQRNNLQSLVSVGKVSGETVLLELIQNCDNTHSESDKVIYDFCMCNPPFFGSHEEVLATDQSRSATQPRSDPNNARTGSPHELISPGGEVAFVKKMIDEGKQLLQRIRIMSTMVGRKASISPILHHLRDAGVKHIAQMEFCQGRVTRWGIAWSHTVNISPEEIVKKKEKPRPPLQFVMKPVVGTDEKIFDVALSKVNNLLEKLQMDCKMLGKTTSATMIQASASTNTWSHQRRRRREQQRQGQERQNIGNEDDPETCKREESEELIKEASEEEPQSSVSHAKHRGGKRKCDSSFEEGSTSKRVKEDDNSSPLLVIQILVKQLNQSDVLLEMTWLGGSGNRETMHQVMQYFMNNLK